MYSLLTPEVIGLATVSGAGLVVLHSIRATIKAHLCLFWNEIAGFVLCIVMPLGLLSLMLWLLSGHSWSHTAYKWIGYAVPFITLLAVALVNGANRGRK